MRPRTRFILSWTVSGALLGVLACGPGDGLDTRYPITGRITVDGKPLASGSINFIPPGMTGRAAAGRIRDGDIVDVTTLTTGDGILPGTYKVTVSAVEESDLTDVVNESGGGAQDQVASSRVMAKAKPLVPMKYMNPDASGLTFEAKAGPNRFDANLKAE